MAAVLKPIFFILPFLFGIGFIAPLIAQAMEFWGIPAPWGLSHVMFGLMIGAPWGLYAVVRGRWI